MSDEELVFRARLDDDASTPAARLADRLDAVAAAAKRADNAADRAAGAGLTRIRGGLDGGAGPAGRFAGGLDRVSGAGRRLVSGAGGLVRSIGSIGLAGAAAGARLGGALAVGAAAGGFAMLKLAADAGETASKFNTVFGDAAGAGGAVGGFVNDLHQQSGIAVSDLQNMAATFGVFGKAAGTTGPGLETMATGLTQAALDLASFYNARPEDVALALRSGLAGEAEPLRQFGIFLSDAAMQTQAATMGLSGELTEQQKVLVRQAIIMESLGDAQGDLARTQDSVANQMKAVSGQAKTLGQTIGTILEPAAKALLPVLGQGLAGATQMLSDNMPMLQERVLGAANGLKSFLSQVVPYITGVRDALREAGPYSSEFGETLGNLPGLGVEAANGVQQFIFGVQNVIGAVQQYDSLVQGLTSVEVWETLGGEFPQYEEQLQAVGRVLRSAVDAFTAVGTALRDDVGPAVASATPSLDSVADAFQWVTDNAEWLVPAAAAGLAGLMAYSSAAPAIGGVKGALEGLRTAQSAMNLVSAVANLLTARTIAGTATLAVTNGTLTASTSVQTAKTLGQTAATLAHNAAMLVVRGATAAWSAAQWLLNAALTANPIGLVVAAVALLVGGLIYAYKNSERFRDIVDTVGRVVRDTFLGMVDAALPALQTIIDSFLGFAESILRTAESAFSWVPGLGPKLTTAREAVEGFRDQANVAIDGVRNQVSLTIENNQAMASILEIDEALATMSRGAGTALRGLQPAIISGDGFGQPGTASAGSGGRSRGPAGTLGPAAGYQAQWAAVQAAGLPIALTSGFRPGSTTRSGNASYHSKGRAVDLGGTAANMLATNRWIAANYGSISKELIYSGPGGINMRNGAPHTYSGGVRSDHFDHVHWALKEGGATWPGMRFLAGEAGPELWFNGSGVEVLGAGGPEVRVATGPGQVVDAEPSAALLNAAAASGGEGGVGTVNVPVTVNGADWVDPARIAAVVQAEMGRQARDRYERATRHQR